MADGRRARIVARAAGTAHALRAHVGAAPVTALLSQPLVAGAPLALWRVGETAQARFDVAPQPMLGEMDPFFFLTKDKNFIPHEYPCRTAFAAERRDRRPDVRGGFAPDRVWLPFGAPRLDLSGFWFRPTVLATWAQTVVRLARGGPARFRLATCGGAVLFVNGREIGWSAAYRRNFETAATFEAALDDGDSVIELFFDDLAERDARYYAQLDWLDGPEGEAGVPVPDLPAARAVAAALEGAHFERPAYTAGAVALRLPPLPVDAEARIRVEGDFMSHQSLTLARALPAGAGRLSVADVADLPGDFRHFTVTLEAAGFSASRVFGVELCHAEAQGPAPAALPDRIAQALGWVATRGEPDTVAALAVYGSGGDPARAAAMIEAVLPTIVDCWDCADFALVPLLWSRIRYGGRMDDALRERVDAAILGYRYWMDEPGDDVQWYFSENHALLFHTAAYLAGALHPGARFVRSGRGGVEQSAVGLGRVRAWLDHFEAWEMAEFNSAPYFPIDLKGLCALYALAPDADVRERARAAIGRLMEVVANSAHHGVVTGAQGRSYEHTLRAARSLELSAVARLLWGAGNLGARFHCLPQLALCLRDHGLSADLALADRASWRGPGEQVWRFAQGQDRFARLEHCKSADFALGTAAAYRWFEWGYQETLLHLRLGTNPDAQVWINHPGEVIHSGYGRPSYWGGSASIPRAQQYRGLAVLWFDGAPEQPGFTHAWFPTPAFDEAQVAGDTAAARSGRGCALIRAGAALEAVASGPTAGCELRAPGRRTWWLVRAGAAERLADFAGRFAGLTVAGGPRDDLRVDDPEYGAVHFRADGSVEAEGRRVDPAAFTVRGERLTPEPAPA